MVVGDIAVELSPATFGLNDEGRAVNVVMISLLNLLVKVRIPLQQPHLDIKDGKIFGHSRRGVAFVGAPVKIWTPLKSFIFQPWAFGKLSKLI